MSGLQGLILSLRGPILGSRGPDLGPRGPLESKVGEKRLVFLFWSRPTRPGGPSMANFTPVTRALAVPLSGNVLVFGEKQVHSISIDDAMNNTGRIPIILPNTRTIQHNFRPR